MALTDILPSSVADPVNSAAQSNWNPVNAVSNGQSYLDNLANNYLVKPATAQGISGFVFDYEGETQIVADSEITDHYTESNKFFNDHDARRPLEITMRGFVGELVQKAPQGLLGAISGLQNRLTTIPGMLGKYTPGALAKVQGVLNSAENVVNKVDNAVAQAKNLVGLIAGGSAAPTKQAQAFGKLMALRDSCQVFNLVTPFGIMAARDSATGKAGPRMFVIKRLTFTQSEETNMVSDITVTMKEVRFADVQGVRSGQSAVQAVQNNAGSAASQRQGPSDKGTLTGYPVPFASAMGAFA